MGYQSVNNDRILLDYYQGAYGPTLRIDILSVDSLHKVKNLLVHLAKSVNHEINMVEAENVVAMGVSRFILQSVSDDKEVEKKLTHVEQSNNGHIFYWKMSSDSWERVVCLVQRLLDTNRPGHQYLTEEGIDDALIEITFMEEIEGHKKDR
jgi:hypothetical protein